MAFSGLGDGNDSTYRIATCEQLNEIRNDIDAKFVLVNNIDCSMTNPEAGSFGADGTWGDGAGFEPMNLSGILDGRNYTISGLFINRPDTDSVAMLSNVSGTV